LYILINNINAEILQVPMDVKKNIFFYGGGGGVYLRRKMVKEIYRLRRCEGMQEGRH